MPVVSLYLALLHYSGNLIFKFKAVKYKWPVIEKTIKLNEN